MIKGGWLIGAMIFLICSSSLSIIGCIFICVSACIFSHLISLPYWRLVLGLTLADLVTSITMLVGGVIHLTGFVLEGTACKVHGFFVEAFAMSANIYILSISFSLYIIVVLQRSLTWKIELILHLIPWTISVIQGIIPLTEVDGIQYSWSGGWCWVDEKPRYARFISSYMVVWMIIICILVIYLRVWWSIRSDRKLNKQKYTLVEIVEGKREENQVLSIFLFAGAFIILWIPSTINRVYEAFYPPWPPLVILQMAFTPLQGFVDSFVYGLTAGIFREIKNRIKERITEKQTKPLSVLAEEEVIQ